MNFITILLSISVFSLSASAKLKIRKPNADSHIKSSEETIANQNYLSFLKCSESDQAQWKSCARPFFAKDVTDATVSRYTEMLNYANEFTELFPCDKDTSAMVKGFEDSKFDLYLCFELNLSAEANSVGIMFFRVENGTDRISKIKL